MENCGVLRTGLENHCVMPCPGYRRGGDANGQPQGLSLQGAHLRYSPFIISPTNAKGGTWRNIVHTPPF